MIRSVLSKQIDKNKIENLKNDTESLSSFLQGQNEGTIVYLLEKLGRLKNGSSKYPLLNLLKNENDKIRALSMKNLAKIEDFSLLHTFRKFAKLDNSTEVRRESVSAIGRLRNKKTIPILIELLSDKDPKVVIQAIRGLLVFINDNQVEKKLSELVDHPNELIKEIILKGINRVNYRLKNKIKHDEFPLHLKNIVVHGDVMEILRYVSDESIHLTFTSPPYYNARDYSIYQSYNDYLCFLNNVFSEILRITKEGRFFVLNTSPIIIPRASRSHASKRYPIPYDIHPLLVKMGWEFIDDIVWLKPEASVKNRNAGFSQHRKPLGYKPNAVTEMLMVYRKKTDKLIDWNIQQYNLNKVEKSKIINKYETTNVWKIDPTFNKTHSAVFPIELCNKIIQYYSFVGDLIFDPFAGSGTLGYASANLHRSFFLTEKEDEYIYYMKKRLLDDINLFNLNQNKPKFLDIKSFANMINGYENS